LVESREKVRPCGAKNRAKFPHVPPSSTVQNFPSKNKLVKIQAEAMSGERKIVTVLCFTRNFRFAD
jgi:hypothetical protein